MVIDKEFKEFIISSALSVYGEKVYLLWGEDMENESSSFSIYIIFDEILVTNENNLSTIIKDLVVRVSFRPSYISIEGTRLTVSLNEFRCGYLHSHLPSTTRLRKFARFCLGSDTEITLNLANIGVKFTEESKLNVDIENRIDALFYQILNIVNWESIEGTPYIKLETIGKKNIYRDSNNDDFDSSKIYSILIQNEDNPLLDLNFKLVGHPNYLIPVMTLDAYNHIGKFCGYDFKMDDYGAVIDEGNPENKVNRHELEIINRQKGNMVLYSITEKNNITFQSKVIIPEEMNPEQSISKFNYGFYPDTKKRIKHEIANFLRKPFITKCFVNPIPRRKALSDNLERSILEDYIYVH